MLIKTSNSISVSQISQVKFSVLFIKNIFTLPVNKKLCKYCHGKKVLIIVDQNVFNIYRAKIIDYFKQINVDHDILPLLIPEKEKNLEAVQLVCTKALEFGMMRNSIFIAIGGGTILDVVGFAASMYRRKLPYIKIPTTLVGIIDAGIGVKVGVNFKSSKSLLGSFYPPIITFNDQSFLKTLSQDNIRSGLFEMLKMAIATDEKLFTLIEKNYLNYLKKSFNKTTDLMNKLSCQLMMTQLDLNLFENNLKRKVDFGHSFGQCIEMNSSPWINHGESVGFDILISSHIALQRQIISDKNFARIIQIISQIGFTKKYSIPSAEKIFNNLTDIRNHRAGNLNLVLPIKIGSVMFTNQCSLQEIQNALEYIKNQKFIQ